MFAIKFNSGDLRSETQKEIMDYARERGMVVVGNNEMRVPEVDEGYDPRVDFVYNCDPYRTNGSEFVCTHSPSARIIAVTEEVLVNGKYKVIDSPFSLYIENKG